MRLAQDTIEVTLDQFSFDQIIDWFKRFKKDCPDGRLTLDHLRTLFRQVFPRGKFDAATYGQSI